jgi:uncharacterized protein (DUF983 family)
MEPNYYRGVGETCPNCVTSHLFKLNVRNDEYMGWHTRKCINCGTTFHTPYINHKGDLDRYRAMALDTPSSNLGS